MEKHTKIQLGVIATSIITSFVAYFYLPDTVASHWNYLGQADAYSSKLTNLIAFPILIIFMYLLLTLVPKMDPLKKNIQEAPYKALVTFLTIFFLLIQYFLILWNMGIQIPVTIFFPALLSILFYFIGDILSVTKRNWTVGIRTKWTLSSDKVWEKTHKLGSKLFKLSLPIFFVSAIFPSITFIVVMAYILGITIYLVAYSYFEYKKINK